MLVLSRKLSQQILVGSDIVITVVKIERNQVRLGIQAPQGIAILRHELTRNRPLDLGPPRLIDHVTTRQPKPASEPRGLRGHGRAAKAGAPTRDQ